LLKKALAIKLGTMTCAINVTQTLMFHHKCDVSVRIKSVEGRNTKSIRNFARNLQQDNNELQQEF
jgi:hypothetical protein